MTEDDAKTKWCPFARYVQGEAASANRWKQYAPPDEPHAMNPVSCRCIASACMSWRDLPWHDTRSRSLYSKRTGEKTSSATTDDADWSLDDPDAPPPPKHGYCGLAGKP